MTFEESLLSWYSENKRDLPWRKKDASFYEVLLSETMLQQTQVSKVREYYTRFMEKYPSLLNLSTAEEEDVLKLWEGLGYYSRARNLLRASKAAVKGFEPTKEGLLALPGVGDYTANALLAFAYHRRAIPIDGNLLRVYSRLEEDGEESLALRKKKGELYFLERLQDSDPSDFNQALMDLGELVCLPNGKPLCERCPFSSFCKAHLDGVETAYPPKKKKIEKHTVFLTVFEFLLDGKVAIRKREKEGLLASLYEFPNVEERFRKEEDVLAFLTEQGIEPLAIKPIGKGKHVFSHLVWEMEGYRVFLRQAPTKGDWLFVTKEDLKEKYSIPSAFRFVKDDVLS